VSAGVEELRTPRLVLRRWRDEDQAPMAAINSHPEVTPFLNRRMGAEAVATFPDRTERHWAEHGFGHWAVEPVAGPAGRRDDRLRRRRLAACDDAFARLGLPALISLIHPENARSQRVAEKLGMSIERQVFNPTHDRDIDVWACSSP
jgi:RimJ/RimL family protein N-acetyltransferase